MVEVEDDVIFDDEDDEDDEEDDEDGGDGGGFPPLPFKSFFSSSGDLELSPAILVFLFS